MEGPRASMNDAEKLDVTDREAVRRFCIAKLCEWRRYPLSRPKEH
jgi:hypothetical protein